MICFMRSGYVLVAVMGKIKMKNPLPSRLFRISLVLIVIVLLFGCARNDEVVQVENSFVCPAPLQDASNYAKNTLQQTILPKHQSIYRVLETCSGWPSVTRTELATRSGHSGYQALLSLVHLSDVHIIDSQSPLRIEFLRHRRGLLLPADQFQAGFRPQEAMSAQVTESMVRQLNKIGSGPYTRRPFDMAVNTGDSGDNHQDNELLRFITLLNGGFIDPNSGAASYQGVQDQHPSPLFCQYWHPDKPSANACSSETDNACGINCQDKFKVAGFPEFEGLLNQAVQPFQATGLAMPWYTAYGNHDELFQGNFPLRSELNPRNALSNLSIGADKLLELPPRFISDSNLGEKFKVDEFLLELLNPLDSAGDWQRLVNDWTGPEARQVAADNRRVLWSRAQYVQDLLDHPGPYGPAGHGFNVANRDTGKLYYAFDFVNTPIPIKGIVLDTTNPGGRADGSLGREQLQWLEQQLQQASNYYFDKHGNRIATGNQNQLVILFSHHNSQTMNNAWPDPTHLLTNRVLFKEFQETLHRYPNMVLWLNGHTHYPRTFPHADSSGRTPGFWEINTPSLIDFPQMARIVELFNNGDGTLSIFGTLIDHAAPAKYTDTSDPVLRLASISRELSVNDPLLSIANQIGKSQDRNVELLIRLPF